MVEVAGLLRGLADWERRLTTNAEVNALVSTVCRRMTAEAKKSVDQFKGELSPEDAPDYRAVTDTLARLEAMIHFATSVDRKPAADEIRQFRDHYAKTALQSALAVIQRAEETADMFVHFDVAAMLVSVENIVAVLSRAIHIVDQERDAGHPHVETVSEHVVRDFANGLKRLSPAYQRMLRSAVSERTTPVPQFVLSVVRVLVQLARVTRILHHLTGDPTLASAAEDIADSLQQESPRVRRIMVGSPELLTRLDDAFKALGDGSFIAGRAQ